VVKFARIGKLVGKFSDLAVLGILAVTFYSDVGITQNLSINDHETFS
jgi:hypothetical protein